MCFSAAASFAAGAALAPAGIYCLKTAVCKDRRFLPLACVPIVFAAQQCTEGLVWHGLTHDDASLVEGASVAYLFFAMAFWPFWIPLAVLCTEQRRGLIELLGLMTLMSLAWTWLYLPIFLDPAQLLTTEVFQHSIRYVPGHLPGYDAAPPWAWRLGYLLLTAAPLIIGCTRAQPNGSTAVVNYVGAAAVLASFAACYYLYMEVFVSLWCFFAAVLSVLLCSIFYRLPEAVDPPWPPCNRGAAVVASSGANDRVARLISAQGGAIRRK
jgi:hypothetical protein